MYKVPPREGESWLFARIRRHVSELVRLALPVIVARAGLLVMNLVDTIMVGRYATRDLAILNLGAAPTYMLVGGGVGLVTGTMVMTANALGRQTLSECGAVLQRSLAYGLGIGILSFLICFLIEPLLGAAGQPQDVSSDGGRIAVIIGYGLPSAMLYTVSAFFLEALKRPVPGMVAMIAANILNVFVNWALIYGEFGMPELGAEGAAWATTVSRTALAAMLIVYIFRLEDRDLLGIRRWAGWRWREWAAMRRIGYGGGASIFVESSAFTALTLIAGYLGLLEAAAYSAALNLLALVFMVALGLATATTVRVGVAHGRHDRPDMALAGWVGLGVNSLVMLTIGIVLATWPDTIARAYSKDASLLLLLAPIVAFSAFILIADGGQVVMAHALRGRGEALVPTILQVVSYLGVMVPFGWGLAVEAEHGVMGLFEAILIASFVSLVLLSLRFQQLALRDRRSSGVRAEGLG